jgi:Mrp family chromosome partitioning ATPase
MSTVFGTSEVLKTVDVETREHLTYRPPMHGAQIAKLISVVFRVEAEEHLLEPGKFITVTAPISGEGVSTICWLIAQQLARYQDRRTLLVQTSQLARLQHIDLERIDSLLVRHPLHSYWQMRLPTEVDDGIATGPWDTDLSFRKSVIDALKQRFHNIILDCRALLDSDDVPSISPWTDGTILVVKAGSSTKQQIQHAIQLVQLAGGEVKGCCLNRRKYPIPESIYRRLRS